MADQTLPLPDFHRAWVDQLGRPTPHMTAWIRGADRRIGGRVDKINAVKTTADAAAPATSEVVAGPGLTSGGTIGENASIGLYIYTGPVAGLPTTSTVPAPQTGQWAFATNGRNSGEGAGSGTGVPVCWTGGSTNLWRIPGVATAVAA